MLKLVKFSKDILSLLIIFFCCFGVIQAQSKQLKSLTQAKEISDYKSDEKQQSVNLNIIADLPSFGFSNLVADWSFYQYIQYFGNNDAREKIGYSLIPQFFELVVQRDPLFLNAYLYLSPTCSIFTGRPDISIHLTSQALQSLKPQTAPDAYYLWFYKGIDELIFLGDIESAKQSYRQAVQWGEEVKTPDSLRLAEIANGMYEFLRRNPDSRRIRISSWMMIYNNVVDQRIKEYIKQQIRNLGGDLIVSNQGGEEKLELIMPNVD